MRHNVFTTYDPNLPSGKKFVAVNVQNEDPLYFLVEVKSKVCELFAQIIKFLNLLDPELFGLAIKNSDTFLFLDPLEKLSKYAPKQWRTQNNGMDNDGLPLFNVYFRVQFYVDSYLFFSDKVAKMLYYHQMRENVLHYGQSMCEERAFMLASFALQADYGNYNSKLHKDNYFKPDRYFPYWVIEELGIEYIVRNLPALHCDHKGMSKSEAQSMFIKEASDAMAPHNFHLYKLSCKKGASSTDVWLAITISGIAIYAVEPPNVKGLKSRISFFPWSDIGKLSFEKKKFEIRSTGSHGRKFVYSAPSEDIARHLLWFSRASHQFHLMVQTKMKEMLRREAEINRRKYRETCVSSTSSRTSSSGNSSGSCSVNNASNSTSKSVSPFEYSSASSTGSAGPKKGTSDFDISNSSVCGEDSHIDQRISVISNASSNTTSGIVSEKMNGLEDSDRDDDSHLMLSLNRHHAVNRAITLSGCSPQPVVSMESLALSEPIEHQSCRNRDKGDEKMNLTSNKKHSISISNIMITTSTPTSSNDAQSYDSLVSGDVGLKTTVNNNYVPVNEVLVNGDKCSKVLCLNINERKESTCCSLSPYARTDDDCSDAASSFDEADSVFDSTSKSYTSGKSNVTVLSTILKPEAERLLKQGIEADDAELLIDDGIDSIELAELKKLENAEKEKLILNSLINNIPPPMLTSSDSESSDEDEDDDDVNNNKNNHSGSGARRNCYSPLAQEKWAHKYYSSPRSILNRDRQKNGSGSSNSSAETRNALKDSVENKKSPEPKKTVHHFTKPSNMNHIYENINSKPSQTVEALVTPCKNVKDRLPPPVPLRQCPSLNAFGSQNPPYQHRTGMRIGVSSLSRPYSAQKNRLNTLLHGGCIHNSGALNSIPSPFGAKCCSNMADPISTLSAGSEPNLYMSNPCWTATDARNVASNKSDSVFDCRVNDSQQQQVACEPTVVPTTPTHPQPYTSTSFRKFIKNQLGSESDVSQTPNSVLSPTSKMIADFAKMQLSATAQQDNNNNIEKIYSNYGQYVPITYATNVDDGLSQSKLTSTNIKTTTSSSPVASQCNNNDNNQTKHKRTTDGSISELHQLKQRSSDLNLPLITALFNDSSLALSNQFRDCNSDQHKMSQSLQQIPNQVDKGSPNVVATVERKSTFRVDEAIAKSATRNTNDANNNTQNSNQDTNRPLSWHKDRWTNNCHEPTGATLSTRYSKDRMWTEHQLTT